MSVPINLFIFSHVFALRFLHSLELVITNFNRNSKFLVGQIK